MTERGEIKLSTRIYNGTIDACVMSKLSKRPGTKNSEEPDGRLSRDIVKALENTGLEAMEAASWPHR